MGFHLLQKEGWCGGSEGDKLPYFNTIRASEHAGCRPAAPAGDQLQGAEGVGEELRRVQTEGEAEGSQLAMGAAAGVGHGGQEHIVSVRPHCGRSTTTEDGAIRKHCPLQGKGIQGLMNYRTGETWLRSHHRPCRTSRTGGVSPERPTHGLNGLGQCRSWFRPYACGTGSRAMDDADQAGQIR